MKKRVIIAIKLSNVFAAVKKKSGNSFFFRHNFHYCLSDENK